MLKYLYCKEVFSEVPGEITLALSISNCQIKCDGCNQKELWLSAGIPLYPSTLVDLINNHRGISCVLFMGSGNYEYKELNKLALVCKEKEIKVAVYLGEDTIPEELDVKLFDYIKIGHWDESKGGLDSPTTNQRLYSVVTDNNDICLIDITNKFLRNNED